MIIQNSPNVTYIDNEGLKPLIEYLDGVTLKSTIHPNGIIQIDTYNKDCRERTVRNAISQHFKLYDSVGHLYPVTKSGLKVEGEGTEVGSMRFCTNFTALADALSVVIQNSDALPRHHIHNSQNMAYKSYEYNSVSPYFRFMQYSKGGMHFPHYDSDFEFDMPNNNLVTRYSLVMYFSDCGTGEIAFINDKTIHCQDKSDWERQATDDEIYLKVKPRVGRIVLFPHHLCHSVLEYTPELGNDTRMMLRGDIIFKA